VFDFIAANLNGNVNHGCMDQLTSLHCSDSKSSSTVQRMIARHSMHRDFVQIDLVPLVKMIWENVKSTAVLGISKSIISLRLSRLPLVENQILSFLDGAFYFSRELIEIHADSLAADVIKRHTACTDDIDVTKLKEDLVRKIVEEVVFRTFGQHDLCSDLVKAVSSVATELVEDEESAQQREKVEGHARAAVGAVQALDDWMS